MGLRSADSAATTSVPSERHHLNPTGGDDVNVSGRNLFCSKERSNEGFKTLRNRRMNPKQHDASLVKRNPALNGNLPKLFVTAKHLDDGLRKALVGKEAHRIPMSGRDRPSCVFVGKMAGVGKAGENVFVANARIVPDESLFGFACSKKFEDELHGRARTPDDGLARKELGVDDDTVRQRHDPILSC